MVINKDNINQFIDDTVVDCSNSGITHIEYIPEGITYLHCSNNKLTSLPNLPNSLTNLFCYNNLLTNLPILPNSLNYLDCSDNKLTDHPTDRYDKQWFIKHNNRLKIEKRSNTIKKILTLKTSTTW